MADRQSGPPPGVAERLQRLRALYIPERDVDARQRLADEARAAAAPFAIAVARRLEELRALSDLTTYLHRRR